MMPRTDNKCQMEYQRVFCPRPVWIKLYRCSIQLCHPDFYIQYKLCSRLAPNCLYSEAFPAAVISENVRLLERQQPLVSGRIPY